MRVCSGDEDGKESELAFIFWNIMEMHPCLPAAPSDLGGLALVTGNKLVVTQEARAFSFTAEFSKDGWRVFKNTIPRKGCGDVDIKSTSFTVLKLLLAALIFRNRIFLWETGDFPDSKNKTKTV